MLQSISLFVIQGVIIFGSDQEVAGLMRAVKHMNATGKFNWIGSDGWSARALVSDGKCTNGRMKRVKTEYSNTKASVAFTKLN